ncbi:MAG: hypothetical protein IKM61_00795 [Eubacteriaceae bacterium]|nr:hypothetical protein [Eubacteriaceae bacterium]
MAKVLKGKTDAEALAAKLERIIERSGITSKCVYKNKRRLDGAKVILLVFEKYFARTNSQTSMTVLITDDGRDTVCEVIASGGGVGFGDGGSEKEYENEVIDILKEEGFR